MGLFNRKKSEAETKTEQPERKEKIEEIQPEQPEKKEYIKAQEAPSSASQFWRELRN